MFVKSGTSKRHPLRRPRKSPWEEVSITQAPHPFRTISASRRCTTQLSGVVLSASLSLTPSLSTIVPRSPERIPAAFRMLRRT